MDLRSLVSAPVLAEVDEGRWLDDLVSVIRLFARNAEQYAAFFSLTCREYESQMIDYEKQRRYRREARNAI